MNKQPKVSSRLKPGGGLKHHHARLIQLVKGFLPAKTGRRIETQSNFHSASILRVSSRLKPGGGWKRSTDNNQWEGGRVSSRLKPGGGLKLPDMVGGWEKGKFPPG